MRWRSWSHDGSAWAPQKPVNPSPWLAPLGAAYGAAGRLRVGLYRRGFLARHRLRGPVISVGNLSVGGSGKTPVVALVAALLVEGGRPVAVLSRGYGGTFSGDALVVSDGSTLLASAREAGDEPVMLARQLPGAVVAVGRRRDVVGRVVEERFGPRVHLLDDGFQHLRLQRDLDLLCASAADFADRPLPAGRLREWPSAAARADAVLLTGDAASAPPGWPAERVFTVRRRVVGFFDRAGAACPPPECPWLLSGIARPERLEQDVEAQGAGRLGVLGASTFPDHHWFSAGDLDGVARAAHLAGADSIVTTAKDLERLPPAWEPEPLRVLRIAAEVDDRERLRRLVLGVAGSGA